MSYQRNKALKLWGVIITALILAGPTTAVAKVQGGVTGGARLRPGTWNNQRASRHVRHARDYSRDVCRYSRDASRIDPLVAKSESEELGRNIAKAQQQKMLHAECCKPSVGGSVSMNCCSSITLDLDKAQAEHDALLRSLEMKVKKLE